MSADALWQGMAMNMHLLSEVKSLNKQIDSYLLLIAKKNREVTLARMKQGKEKGDDDDDVKEDMDKDEEQEQTIKHENKDDDIVQEQGKADNDSYHSPNRMQIQQNNENTNKYLSPMSVVSNVSMQSHMTVSPQKDPREEYADQLVAKNRRYQDIMKLLRKKVDELREC